MTRKTDVSAATRVADFARRASFAPDQVLTHVGRHWRYIAVHPFADDHELLARLSLPADRCLSVDAYWECEGDIYFVQVYASSVNSRKPGQYYRWDGGHGYAANVVVIIDQSRVVRETFESVLNSLASKLSNLGSASTLTPLTD